VITENARVHRFVEAISHDDIELAGSLMADSHRSLRDDYESSTPQIDELCRRLGSVPGVLGVRITGGGWGGCVVALTRPGALEGEGLHVIASDGAHLLAVGG
jgi:galactokinase